MSTAFVFGRRGAGKSRLLAEVASEAAKHGLPAVEIDLDHCQEECFPDVVIQAMIRCLKGWGMWLGRFQRSGILKNKRTLRIQGVDVTISAKELEKLHNQLSAEIGVLEREYTLQDANSLEIQTEQEKSGAESATAKVDVGPKNIRFGGSYTSESNARSLNRITERGKRSKLEFISKRRNLYSELARKFGELTGQRYYILIDNLHCLPLAWQPHVLEYAREIFKGSGAAIKIAAVQNRSQWFINGNPPVGISLNNDAPNTIMLDVGLQDFPRAESLLRGIADEIAAKCGLSAIDEVVGNDALRALVVCSGGVPRDFIRLLEASLVLASAREDVKSAVTKSDVLEAAIGDLDAKKAELFADGGEEARLLKELFIDIMDQCLSAKSMFFRVPSSIDQTIKRALGVLADSRIVHCLESEYSIPGTEGVHSCYMLDMSCCGLLRARVRNFRVPLPESGSWKGCVESSCPWAARGAAETKSKESGLAASAGTGSLEQLSPPNPKTAAGSADLNEEPEKVVGELPDHSRFARDKGPTAPENHGGEAGDVEGSGSRKVDPGVGDSEGELK